MARKIQTGDNGVLFTATTTTAEERIKPEVSALAQSAKTIAVTNMKESEEAGVFLQGVKAMRKKVAELCDPVVKANHAAWKAAVAMRAVLDDPLETAEREVKSKIGAYLDHQESLRRAEEARRTEEAHAAAKARAEEEAATMDVLDEPEAAAMIRAEPVPVPVVNIAPVAKPSGISTSSTWKARIIDESKIPREFLCVDMVKINAYARAMKDTGKIEGVQIYEDKTVSVR